MYMEIYRYIHTYIYIYICIHMYTYIFIVSSRCVGGCALPGGPNR